MRKSLLLCDKCSGEIEPRTGITLNLPGPSAAQPQPVRGVDLCETHASELLRWLGEPALSVTELERRVTELGGANARLVAELARVSPPALASNAATDWQPTDTAPAFDASACYCSDFASGGVACPAGQCPNVPRETEPPAPLLVARTPASVGLLAVFGANEPLPEAFVLPGQAFEFTTEAPPLPPQSLPASPLDFTHSAQS